MAVHGGDHAYHELWHGGAHGDDGEADDAVGQAYARGDLAGSGYQHIRSADEQREAE